MRIYVAVPCMEKLDVEFVQSLENMKRVGLTSVNFLSGSLVYDSRDRLVERAIYEKSDYILWLDSDMVFKPTLLKDMITDEKDFVCGLYFRRKPPFNPVIYKQIKLGLIQEETKTEEYDDYPKEELFEIDGCGFGAVLMKTEVAEAVVNKYHAAFAPMYGFGEDLSFCIRAKKLGYKLWCDSRIKVGHVAKAVVDEATWMARKKVQV